MTRVNTSSRPVELFGLALARTKPGSCNVSTRGTRYGRRISKHRPPLQVNFFDLETGQLLGDGLVAGQEAELSGIPVVAQSQVDAPRLDVPLRDGPSTRLDPAGFDGFTQELAGKDPLRSCFEVGQAASQ